VCRLLPPTHRVSVSPMEIADAQIQVARVGFVPGGDPASMKVGGNFRLISDAQKFASRGSMKSGLRGNTDEVWTLTASIASHNDLNQKLYIRVIGVRVTLI
jgi:hypothetical protein